MTCRSHRSSHQPDHNEADDFFAGRYFDDDFDQNAPSVVPSMQDQQPQSFAQQPQQPQQPFAERVGSQQVQSHSDQQAGPQQARQQSTQPSFQPSSQQPGQPSSQQHANKPSQSSEPLSRTEQRSIRRYQRHQRAKRAWKIVLICLCVCAVIAAIVGGVSVLVRKLNAREQAQTVRTEEATDWPGPGYGSVEFTIETGESAASVGEHLAQKKIVASAQAFTQAVEDADAGNKIKPGTFTLKYRMSAKDVVAIVIDSSQAKGLIEVTASDRISDVIASAAAESKTISKQDLQTVLNGNGGGILPAEAHGKFEGWLQPGTYDPKSYTSARQLVADMVKKRIAFLNALKVPTGQERERILTIASIIGGEVNRQEYYGKVSRVIANRLSKNMSLGMDSVLAYGNNVRPSQITQSMIEDESNAYNSRIKKGLPPTPINQPDKAMIEAAMHPDNGSWLYFVTVNLDTGETKFTDNEEQFQQYAQEYRKWAASHK